MMMYAAEVWPVLADWRWADLRGWTNCSPA